MNQLPSYYHIYGNGDGSRNRGFRNGSFHVQEAVSRERARDFGGIHLQREPDEFKQRKVSHRIIIIIIISAGCSAYLCFLVKHLAMDPRSSGLSSCLPGDGFPFTGRVEDTQTNRAARLTAEINFCHTAVILISPSTLFKQFSNSVTFSFFHQCLV